MRSVHRAGLATMVFAYALAWPSKSNAQLNPLPEAGGRWCDLRADATGGFALCDAWSARTPAGRRTADVLLTWMGADLRPDGAPVVIHHGDTVLAAPAWGRGVAVVALVRGGDRPSVRVASIARATGAVHTTTLTRQAGSGYSPVRAVASAFPDGFAVLWQERSRSDPGDLKSYFGRVHDDGTVVQAPNEVAVEWSFGAMEWNGKGYALALYYDGASYGQTRLSMVTLSASGQPEQHPWWISRPEAVADVQLLSTPAGMMAVWRGGADETALHSTISVGVGSWGTEAPEPLSHGSIGPDRLFVVRMSKSGPPQVEQVGLPR